MPSPPQRAEGKTRTETTPSELHSVDRLAQAGDYVALTIFGTAQVKVASAMPIAARTRLAVAAAGRVRPLQTHTIDGMVVTEGAPVLGVALKAASDGLVWVLVNPQ
jgi:hypothetical protein